MSAGDIEREPYNSKEEIRLDSYEREQRMMSEIAGLEDDRALGYDSNGERELREAYAENSDLLNEVFDLKDQIGKMELAQEMADPNLRTFLIRFDIADYLGEEYDPVQGLVLATCKTKARAQGYKVVCREILFQMGAISYDNHPEWLGEFCGLVLKEEFKKAFKLAFGHRSKIHVDRLRLINDLDEECMVADAKHYSEVYANKGS